MDKAFHLQIISCDRQFYDGPCEMLVFQGLDGEYGVLRGHEPMVTCLTAGELRYKIDDEWHYAAISNGFISVNPDRATVMADTAESPEEIDIRRANEAKLRAEELLRQKQSIKEYYHTQAALNRAMNRLKVTRRHMP